MVKPEVELLTGEAVSVLPDVGPSDDGHLFTGDGAGCERQGEVGEEDSNREGGGQRVKEDLPQREVCYTEEKTRNNLCSSESVGSREG